MATHNPREVNLATMKQRYKENREEILEKQRLYRQMHRERYIAKVECDCGSTHSYEETSKHRKTKKHQAYLATTGTTDPIRRPKMTITEDKGKNRFVVRVMWKGVDAKDMRRRFPFGPSAETKERAKEEAEAHRQYLLEKYFSGARKGEVEGA